MDGHIKYLLIFINLIKKKQTFKQKKKNTDLLFFILNSHIHIQNSF